MKTRMLQVLAVLLLWGGGIALASDGQPQGAPAEALRIARESQAHWSLGQVTVRQRQGKSPRAHAELVLRGKVVARLRLDPGNGTFFAEKERPGGPGEALDLPTLRAAVERSLRQLEVGEWTWPTDRGRAWRVPLRYGGRVVGKLKVDIRRGVLPKEDDDDDDDDD